MSKNIKDTVDYTLGFHGRQPDAVTVSIVDALEIREAQIQADLLRVAVENGMDEDAAASVLHDVFTHREADTLAPTVENVLSAVTTLSRQLSEQTALLGTLV